MAPEIFEGKLYGKKVDIWALGILLYELFHFKSPFFGKNGFEIYRKILGGDFFFGKDICEKGKDLCLKILKICPDERIGIEEILKHEFFHDGNFSLGNEDCVNFLDLIHVRDNIFGKLDNKEGFKNLKKKRVLDTVKNKTNNVFFMKKKFEKKDNILFDSGLTNKNNNEIFKKNIYHEKGKLSNDLEKYLKKKTKIFRNNKTPYFEKILNNSQNNSQNSLSFLKIFSKKVKKKNIKEIIKKKNNTSINKKKYICKKKNKNNTSVRKYQKLKKKTSINKYNKVNTSDLNNLSHSKLLKNKKKNKKKFQEFQKKKNFDNNIYRSDLKTNGIKRKIFFNKKKNFCLNNNFSDKKNFYNFTNDKNYFDLKKKNYSEKKNN